MFFYVLFFDRTILTVVSIEQKKNAWKYKKKIIKEN